MTALIPPLAIKALLLVTLIFCNSSQSSAEDNQAPLYKPIKAKKNIHQPNRKKTKGYSVRSKVKKEHTTQHKQDTAPPSSDFLEKNSSLAPYSLKIGEIVSVNPHYKFAVAYLETRFITISDLVVSRNRELKITGIYRPNEMRRGRTIGLDLLYGNPQLGQALVMPNKHLKMKTEAILSQNLLKNKSDGETLNETVFKK